MPIDGSRAAHRAVRHVVNRAKREGPLEVELVGLEPLLAAAPEALVAFPLFASLLAPARARDARALLAWHRIPHRLHRARGDPARAIARVVRSQACNEVVMGRLGEGGLLRRHSLAREVERLSRKRVTVVD